MTVPLDHSEIPPRPTGLTPVAVNAVAATAGLALADRGSGGDGGSGSPAVVTGVTLRSTDVRPGDLFLALPGTRAHGARFAADAERAGAVAILTDRDGLALLDDQPATSGLPVLIAERPRDAVGAVAAEIYHHPSRDLAVIGVTGTSGKTTTCFLIEAALTAAGRRAGVIGTVGARIDGEPLPSALTTPEAPDLQALFAVMRQRGVDAVAMEVSSHALALGRVDGTRFAVGAFTNLSQDHLDFHGDMEHYFAAKRLLFDGRARTEVIVIDDDYGRRLAADRPAARTVTGVVGTRADWSVAAAAADGGDQQLTVRGPGGLELAARIALPGAFNVTNAVTALACVAAAGVDPTQAARGLASVHVPGRMQRVEQGQPFLAVVDYAHKPAALGAVLTAIREHCTGRVIVVVGAGGDRDHGKRPMMGEIAARLADHVIVTDDNPRSEDPAAIRAQILAGARSAAAAGRIEDIGDRRAAIVAAVRAAGAGDAVLIAGKGHEQGQDVGGVVRPFSDVAELSAALRARMDESGGRG